MLDLGGAAPFARAETIVPEPPRPLGRELQPADPFPVQELGAVLADAASAIHEKVQAPLAICGQSVLGAATLAVQAYADVRLPNGQARPISSFLVTVAASGERKSAADTEALWPIRKREAALREAYDAAQQSYANDKAAWDKARDVIIKKSRGNRPAIKTELDHLGPPPDAPLYPMLTCPEPTFEGLFRLLATGHPSIGIFSAEGGQFMGGHSMSEENKLRSAAGLSGLWDGEPIRRVRAGDGMSCLPGRRVAMHLMVQPDVSALMLSDRLLVDQGLLSRMLVTAPESTAGTRLWKEAGPQADASLRRYAARLIDIQGRPYPLSAGKTNELEPRVLELNPEARRMWIVFVDEVERQVGPEGALARVRGLANKLAEHAVRLSAVLALVDRVDRADLPAEYLARGILLAQHYASEALRLFEAGQVSKEIRLAQRLLHWLWHSWGEPLVSLPDIYQRGLNLIADQATARRIVSVLESHGWLIRVPGGATVAGARRQEVWRVVMAG